MNFQQTRYLVNDSFRTLGRHKGIMALSVMIMSLTLLVLAVFLLATDNMMVMLGNAREDLKVYVYLEDGLDLETIEQHHLELLSMGAVESTVFISKAEALDEFQGQLGVNSPVLQSLETNPLPASFRVTLARTHRDVKSTEKFAAAAALMPGVEEVNYGKDFLERLSTLTRGFLYVDIVLGLIVLLSSVFIISNTVRLTILSRQKSIEILKLVGATNGFIRTPFLIEGALQGGLASVVSLALLLVIHLLVQNIIPDVTFLSWDRMLVYVVACVLLGSMGSWASLRRFLRI